MAYYCKYYKSPAATELSKKLASTHDTWTPEADIFETASEIIAIINLPGVDAADIELVLDKEQLIVTGTRKLELPHLIQSYIQLEIRHGRFERILDLPCEVDLGKANISNGVLEITLPKTPKNTDKSRTIAID